MKKKTYKQVVRYLTINDLDKIIGLHYKLKDPFILKCEVGNVTHQLNTARFDLGAGAILTICVQGLQKE